MWGSLNISGDPSIQVTTPGVSQPGIGFNDPVGQPFSVLNDPDGNFKLDVTLHEINDQHNVGIQQADFSVNGKQVQFANDGSLMVDGQNLGNINSGGFLGPIDLGNGNTVRTAMMDDGGGNQVERFVLTTPEYEVTAARRQPNQTKAYYDVNVAERKADAADNATGDTLSAQPVSIADLLRQEPG